MTKKTIIYLYFFAFCKLSFCQDINYDDFIKSELITEGKTSPKIELLSITGEKINLDNLRGKHVLLNFWATWCKPCIEKMPYFNDLYLKHKSDNFELVYISVDESKDKWEKFVLEKKLKGINLFSNGKSTKPISFFITSEKLDENGRVAATISEIPVYVLVDPEGKILENDLHKLTPKEIGDYIEKIL